MGSNRLSLSPHRPRSGALKPLPPRAAVWVQGEVGAWGTLDFGRWARTSKPMRTRSRSWYRAETGAFQGSGPPFTSCLASWTPRRRGPSPYLLLLCTGERATQGKWKVRKFSESPGGSPAIVPPSVHGFVLFHLFVWYNVSLQGSFWLRAGERGLGPLSRPLTSTLSACGPNGTC